MVALQGGAPVPHHGVQRLDAGEAPIIITITSITMIVTTTITVTI